MRKTPAPAAGQAAVEPHRPAAEGTPRPSTHGLGERLRARRAEVGISLRELARRVEVSASLVSQIETGKVHPSVTTLYAIISELGGSLDEMLFGDGPATSDLMPVPAMGPNGSAARALAHPPGPSVQRGDDRKALQLNRGVRWERLTRESVPGVEFLYVVYEPGAESGPPDSFQRHSGREWGYIVSGTLDVDIGFETYVLAAGDSITYDSGTPHRLHNQGTAPVEAIWFQLA